MSTAPRSSSEIAGGRGRHLLHDHGLHVGSAEIIVVASLKHRLLAAHDLLHLVRAEAGGFVLQELARPGIVAARDLLALGRVVDRVGEVDHLLEQQRAGFRRMERDHVAPFSLDLVLLLDVDDAGLERPESGQVQLAYPGPTHVLGGQLVAPVAHDALAQPEAGDLTVVGELPFLGELAGHRQVVRLVSADADVLAPRVRRIGVRDLLVAEQVVVQRADRVDGTEADVELVIEALRRRRRGDHHGRLPILREDLARRAAAEERCAANRGGVQHETPSADRRDTPVLVGAHLSVPQGWLFAECRALASPDLIGCRRRSCQQHHAQVNRRPFATAPRR